mgnify:CR=1 FL=1
MKLILSVLGLSFLLTSQTIYAESLFNKMCKKEGLNPSMGYLTTVVRDGRYFQTCGKGILTSGGWTGSYISSDGYFVLLKEPGILTSRSA